MISRFSILAFGFGNALMLGWLAAAAVPLVIHLWSRRKYRESPWAAIEFLLAALQKRARRIQLEQWLLLALRTLLVVLVVLAVAEPFLEHAGLRFAAGQRTLKVLVIDGSYSMAYKPADKSRFDRAKQSASQIVRDSSQGDGFALVLMASPPSVVVGTPAMERNAFLDEIENLKLTHGGADLPSTLVKVEEMLTAAKKSGLARAEVYFLTDLGRNSWLPDLRGSEAEAQFRHRIERLGHAASLVVMDVGQHDRENLALSDLRLNEPYATLNRDVTIQAQVRNFGTQPRNRHPVDFFVDGRRAKRTLVDVDPAGESTTAFNYRFDTPGDHVIEARLGPDLLDVDNHRWLTLHVKQHLRVLCVNGKPAGEGMSGATDYLALALNPEQDRAGTASDVRAEVIPESGLLERDLSQYDCVFLCNVGQFTPSEARLLDAYLKQGGGLVFFLGDQVRSERYNQELAGDHGVRVLPVRLQGPTEDSSYRFDPLNYRHPLVAKFNGREEAGLIQTPIYKYIRLAVAPHSQAKVALAFEGGDPAIVEESIHRGRSIVVATDGSLSSIDPVSRNPWTTMPAWPSYVPIVHELLALAVGNQTADRTSEVGQVLGAVVPPAAGKAPPTIQTPDGRHEQLNVTAEASGNRWAFGDTLQSGVYTVEFGPPLSASQQFTVNVDTRESDLTRIEPDELPPQFSANRRPGLDESEASPATPRTGLNKALLYAAMVLLLLETCLACRFGHHS